MRKFSIREMIGAGIGAIVVGILYFFGEKIGESLLNLAPAAPTTSVWLPNPISNLLIIVVIIVVVYGLYTLHRGQLKSEPSDTVLDEQTTAVLIRLAKSDYRHTLRDQLNYIWKKVDEGGHPRFLIWKNLSPVLKKLLIPYKPEYDALEGFANALDQFSDNDNKVDSDALKTLCKNRFERLKELRLAY